MNYNAGIFQWLDSSNYLCKNVSIPGSISSYKKWNNFNTGPSFSSSYLFPHPCTPTHTHTHTPYTLRFKILEILSDCFLISSLGFAHISKVCLYYGLCNTSVSSFDSCNPDWLPILLVSITMGWSCLLGFNPFDSFLLLLL